MQQRCCQGDGLGEHTRDARWRDLQRRRGRLTRRVLEFAVFIIVVPFLSNATSKDQNRAKIRSALKAYNDVGYTSVADLAMDEAQWSILHSTKAELTLRVAAFWLVNPSEDEARVLAQVDKAIEMR